MCVTSPASLYAYNTQVMAQAKCHWMLYCFLISYPKMSWRRNIPKGLPGGTFFAQLFHWNTLQTPNMLELIQYKYALIIFPINWSSLAPSNALFPIHHSLLRLVFDFYWLQILNYSEAWQQELCRLSFTLFLPLAGTHTHAHTRAPTHTHTHMHTSANAKMHIAPPPTIPVD